MRTIIPFLSIFLLSSVASGFMPLITSTQHQQHVSQQLSSSSFSITTLNAAKGFGNVPEKEIKKKEKSTGQIKRDNESNKYDDIASTGGQEYNVFVRQFGSDDKSWLPCGAVAVPRGAQVSDAIFANEDALKIAIVRTYKKLLGFESEFEFGYNLKIYPDDPIDVAKKGTPRKAGMSVGNWISTLLSPVDTSGVSPPKV